MPERTRAPTADPTPERTAARTAQTVRTAEATRAFDTAALTRRDPGCARTRPGRPSARRRSTRPPGRASERFRLRVHPFYRDGAYLTAVFELVNIGGRELDRGPASARVLPCGRP